MQQFSAFFIYNHGFASIFIHISCGFITRIYFIRRRCWFTIPPCHSYMNSAMPKDIILFEGWDYLPQFHSKRHLYYNSSIDILHSEVASIHKTYPPQSEWTIRCSGFLYCLCLYSYLFHFCILTAHTCNLALRGCKTGAHLCGGLRRAANRPRIYAGSVARLQIDRAYMRGGFARLFRHPAYMRGALHHSAGAVSSCAGSSPSCFLPLLELGFDIACLRK